MAIVHARAELAVQGRIREVGDMRSHPRDAEAAMRVGTLLEVAPVVPIGIGHHGLPAELVKRDVLGRVAGAAGPPPPPQTPLWGGPRPPPRPPAPPPPPRAPQHPGT